MAIKIQNITVVDDSRNIINVDKVGIGTSQPSSSLDVVGDINVSGMITAATFVGGFSGTATNADIATYATSSGIATYATSSGIATYSEFSGIATYATSSGIATSLQTARNFEIIGDIIASPISFDGTGNVSLAATIQPNSVGLGTDTTGDYIQSISGTGNQITVTGGTGEGSTPTLSIPNQFTIPQDVTVTRDIQINRNLNVNGNITIGGSSATLFTTEFKVFDPDIVLGFRTDANDNDASTDNTANHGGVAIASTEGSPLVQLFIAGIETNPATYKKIMWFKSGSFTGLNTDAWLINYAVGIGSTQFPNGTRLAAGAVQFTERDLAVVRNINASGIVTASGGFNLGISSAGTAITSGPIRTLNFIGAGNTFNVNGTTVDISISGGGGGSSSQWVTTAAGINTLSNVGIGTTNPTTRLQIQGVLGFGAGNNIRIGDNTTGCSITSGTNNFFTGFRAGQCNTTGNNNNFFGRYTGRDNTTGSDNNFFGNSAGFANTTGSHNNFLGFYSGISNTTGCYNNFFGRFAGVSNNSGCQNNFFGSVAGFFNTTGSNNNFFGNRAGFANTTGSNNNFLGSYSGNCNTTGGYNNFFGPSAGRSNTTGGCNNFFGPSAGRFNTTGSHNNFFGSVAGFCNTTGCNNNFFGTSAGQFNTTGSFNNFFGCRAGNNNNIGSYNNFFGVSAGCNNTTGSFNVVIGPNRTSTPILNGNNQLVIGAGNTDWIIGNSSYFVGIGTTNPTSRLHVVGNALINGITTVTGNLNAPGNYYVKVALLTNRTIPNGVDTLIGFSTIADPNSWYTGITTRTTPTVSGTYNVTGMVNWQAGSIANNQTNIQLRKNGTTFAVSQVGIQTFNYTQNVSGIVTMNGTTDYIDFTAYTANPTSQDLTGTADGAWTKMEIFKIN